MMNLDELHDKLQHGEVLLLNDYEDCIVRMAKHADYVKFRGRKEFKAGQGSNVVTQAILDRVEVSKEDYLNF